MNVRENIILNANKQRAFSFATDIDLRTKFIPELEEILYPEGKVLQVGLNYIEVASIAGRKIQTRYQVIGLEMDKYIAVKTVKSLFPIQVILLVTEQSENEVLLTIDLKAELKGIYKIAAPVVSLIIKERTKKILKNIRTELESSL